jgi:hypothetical protein
MSNGEQGETVTVQDRPIDEADLVSTTPPAADASSSQEAEAPVTPPSSEASSIATPPAASACTITPVACWYSAARAVSSSRVAMEEIIVSGCAVMGLLLRCDA